MNAPFGFLGLLFFIVLQCSPSKPLPTQNETPIFGMRKILALGKSFVQGAQDSLASANDFEKPSMNSGFSYDFWMDTSEVTQKEYAEVSGLNPLPDSVLVGKGERYPVAYVSWFDAVLFCNSKSKLNNRDTVYSYFSKKSLPTGSVYDLAGLRIQYYKNGFRLPTEAEWEYCARGGTSTVPSTGLADESEAQRTAWFNQNSINAAHPVTTLQPNAFGLYDMAGNVYEWTNDWKGQYFAKNIINSIGASQPNSYVERVMKGGSFKHGFLYLRPSRRSATYPVTLSTTADFIGFRCAVGAIALARYCVADSTAILTNPVDLVMTTAMPFLGTNHAKLVFTNVTGSERTLCCIDFARGIPEMREFTDKTDVFVPTISPNGQFVAFCNKGEGLSGSAQVSVRCLDSASGSSVWKLGAQSAFVPRWWIDKLTKDTFLIYTNSGIDNGQSSWHSAKTIMQKMVGGKPSGNPQDLIGNGGFHDGLSYNGQYAVSGYTQCIMRDIYYSWDHQLFVSPGNGKDDLGSAQVCNVSISPDALHPERCLFLDFGYPRQSALTQSVYGPHEYLFIADFSGKTIAWIKCPPSESSWDFPEWSNVPGFAVASARNNSDDAHALYLVNLESGASAQVAQGIELDHPGLWVENVSDRPVNPLLSRDSLGVYNDPFIFSYQATFSYKMHYFWKMHRDLDVLFIGSSQVLSDIDCSKITGLSSYNLGIPSAGLATSDLLIRNYALPACPKIKVIGLSSSIFWLNSPSGESVESWKNSLSNVKGYHYDQNHNFWRDSFPDKFDSYASEAPFLNCSTTDTLGLLTDPCADWGGSNPDRVGDISWTVNDSNYRINMAAIVRLIQDLASKKIQLLMVNFPESPAYKNTDHYTRNGASWETGKAVVAQLKALESTSPYFHFYDAYLNGNHDYTDAEAQNWNHLCTAGAAKLTTRLDSLIHTFLQ